MNEPSEELTTAATLDRDRAGEAPAPRHGREDRPKRGRPWLAVAVTVVAIAGAGAAVYVIKPFSSPPPAPAASADPTGLQPVVERSLSQQTTVDGTLGYADSYTVVVPTAGSQPSGAGSQQPGAGSQSSGSGQQGSAPSGSPPSGSGGQGPPSGTFTALPAVGQVVHQGQSIYSVSGSPVALLYGAVPAYRTLSQGMTGTDVKQLNADLVALGDATRSQLDPGSDVFGAATATALDKLQDNLGLPQTGTLPLGQAVFQPTALRVGSVSATLGESAQPGGGVLQATSTVRQVVAQVDTTQQDHVAPGAQVSIVLPNTQTTPGVVTSVSSQVNAPSSGSSGSAGSSGSSGSSSSNGSGSSPDTVDVDIKMNDPSAAGSIDQAPVQVNITTATVHDALVVPIDALLAEPSGYAVEIAGAFGARHAVPVTLGLFDDADGLVQVTGTGLSAGQQVVVPKL